MFQPFYFQAMIRFYYLVILLSAFLIASCAGTKDASLSENTTPLDCTTVKGIITNTYREQGCSFLFEFEDENGVKQIVRPLELNAEFQKDGLKVILCFRPSKAMNDGCDLARPVIVEQIKYIDQ